MGCDVRKCCKRFCNRYANKHNNKNIPDRLKLVSLTSPDREHGGACQMRLKEITTEKIKIFTNNNL